MDIILIATLLVCLYGVKVNTGGSFYDSTAREQTNCINGVFVIFVFFRHFEQYITTGKFDTYFAIVNKNLGQLIVVSFLFYSGFGIMTSIKRKGWAYVKGIPKNRLFKVWYRYALAVLLYILVNAVLGKGYSIQDTILAFVGYESIGNSNWYVFCTLMLYVFTYVSFFKLYSKPLAGVLLLGAMCIGYCVVLSKVKDSYWYNTVVMYPVGMLYALYKQSIDGFLQKSLLRYVISLFMAMVCTLGLAVAFVKTSSIIVFGGVCIVYMLVILLVTMKFHIQNRVLSFLGAYTFEVYILQRIPMRLFQGLISNEYIFFAVSLGGTLLLAIAFKKTISCLESHCNQKK